MTRILIQGVGGVGGLIAGELLRAGADVTLVTGNPAITEAINQRGIRVKTPDDEFYVAATAYSSIAHIPALKNFDCAYLTMMATNVIEGAEAAAPRLTENGYFVAFQNGFVEEAIGEAVGVHRVISATVALGSTMVSPGVYQRTTQGRLIVGELDGRSSARLDDLQTTLSAIIDTEISRNIVGVLWGKLIWNGAVSCLCAVSGKTLGELFDCAIGRELFLLAFRESVDTARAQNIEIETVIVKPEKYYFAHSDSNERHTILLESLTALAKLYAGVTPSTLESLRRGRKTEVDFLNGYIIKKAIEKNIAVLLNEIVVSMVRDIETKKRAIAPSNLDELARRYASATT
ncbi:MAG: 2-dehydropantoate 2-reductase [Proteobacteria bacterium]|nr:2-dehydropantoate 2-reductase [Pseudomonadota bacterium]